MFLRTMTQFLRAVKKKKKKKRPLMFFPFSCRGPACTVDKGRARQSPAIAVMRGQTEPANKLPENGRPPSNQATGSSFIKARQPTRAA